MGYNFSIDQLKKTLNDFKIKSDGLSKIITPIENKYNLETKEVLEVCQIGKFVYFIDGLTIINKPQPPAPDFILEKDKKIIGLEHTQIVSKNAKKYYGALTLINKSEEIFSEKYPDTNIHATIRFKNDEIKYKLNQKSQIGENIADYIYNSFTQKENKIELDFIKDIRISNHSKVVFSYVEQNWESKHKLTNERLVSEIKKKEKKISEYNKSHFNIDELWLVLLVGSLFSESYSLEENTKYSSDSIFDRVYLMSDFNEKILRIK